MEMKGKQEEINSLAECIKEYATPRLGEGASYEGIAEHILNSGYTRKQLIREKIEKRLPNELWHHSEIDRYADGYNQCLKDIKQILSVVLGEVKK